MKDIETEEFFPISIEEIQWYVDEGWILYDVSTEREIKKHGIRRIDLVSPDFRG